MRTAVRKTVLRTGIVLWVAAWSVGLSSVALGADTIETWGIGATNIEYYLGLDGLGLESRERTVSSAVVLGYGIVDGFSGYFGASLQSDDRFGQGMGALSLGIFGTPVDTRHFDMDLILDSGISGPGLSEFSLTPGIEFNVDSRPDLAIWGFYLRAGIPIYGGSAHGGPHHTKLADPGRTHRNFSLCLNPGAYLRVAPGHQLLIEYDVSLHYRKVDGRSWENGGLAMGYNAVLSDSIELITQAYLDVPQHDDGFSVGLLFGFIATMPSSR
jgi:hypothetical protein